MQIKRFLPYIILLISACNINPNPYPDCVEREYTIQEKQLIKELEKDSILDLFVSRFHYNYRPNSNYRCENQKGVYRIGSFTTPISMYEDSVKLNNYLKDLIVFVYTDILDDSLKYFTPCIEIDFSSSEQNKKFPKGTSIYRLALVKDVQAYLGEKIISDGGRLKKIQIDKVKELKMCLNDTCGDKWWY